MAFRCSVVTAILLTTHTFADDTSCDDTSCFVQHPSRSLLQFAETSAAKENNSAANAASLNSRAPAAWSTDEVRKVKNLLKDIMEDTVKDNGGSTAGKKRWRRALEKLDQVQPCKVEKTGTCNRDGTGCVFFDCWDKKNVTSAAKVDDMTVNGKKFYFGAGSVPSAPKFLRLGFHDCVKNKDGTGGCDGCLNLDGMYVLKNLDQTEETCTRKGCRKIKSDFKFDFQQSGGNAGLGPVADLLEWVYNLELLDGESLKATGKSRADLWALATLVATEVMLEKNNEKCRAGDHVYKFKRELGIAFDCEAVPTRPLEFLWGRRDCTEGDKPPESSRLRPYQTTKIEAHPNAEGSGKDAASFFEKQFNFNGRETVAIMGAHTVGDFSSSISGFRYTWMGRESGNEQAKMLNNLYYRYMAMRPSFMKSDLAKLERMPAEGKPFAGQTHWLRVSRGLTPGGGPWQWFYWVRPEASGFFSGRTHNTMLNSDMGMYLNFNTLSGGTPVQPDDRHCARLGKHKAMENIQFYTADAKMCRQDRDAGTGDGSTMADVVEEYADDQNKWIDDFYKTLEKMLSNGQSGLTAVE